MRLLSRLSSVLLSRSWCGSRLWSVLLSRFWCRLLSRLWSVLLSRSWCGYCLGHGVVIV